MKHSIASISLHLFIVTCGIVFNFSHFLMGGSASLKNLVVTLLFFVSWMLILQLCFASKNKFLVMYFIIFWIATAFFASLTVYVNMTDAMVSWAIPFVILFLTPWSGLTFLSHNYLFISTIIAIISFIFVFFLFYFDRKTREV